MFLACPNLFGIKGFVVVVVVVVVVVLMINAANAYACLSQRLKYLQVLQTQRIPDTISMQQWLQGCWRWTIMKSSLIGYIVSPSFTKE
jgi:hypothetical protein